MPPTSSETALRSGERRRNPRHNTRSIIYAEIASGNGGIIVNLGIEGLAFQAVAKLTAERNSTLNFRLRGDGLKAEVSGNIVWLSATQKEAGVCFQALSGNVRQTIADWIARQEQICEDVTSKAQSQPRSKPAMPGTHAVEEASVPKSSSTAPVAAVTVPAVSPPSTHTDPSESRWRASVRPVAAVPPATIQVELPPDHANSIASAEQPQVEKPPELPMHGLLSVGLSKPAGPVPASEERRRKDELSHSEEVGQVSREGLVLSPPVSSHETTEEETWIPPALLTGWKRRNLQQKLLLVSMAAGCFWVLVLILILTVMRIPRSPDPSVGSGPLQQTIAAPAVAASSRPEMGPPQAPPALHVAVQSPPDRRWTSMIASFFEGFVPKDKTTIDKSQDSVQVWISKGSGYYYCAGSPYYQKVRPGALMSQGDALQSGYQPKLGDACN